MNILKNKKFIISLVAIILVILLTVAAQVKASGNERLEQYEKYCQENCELTKVTREELEQTIDTRKGTAIASIEKSSKSISDITKYLTEHELNDEESKMLGSLKPVTIYSKDEEYTVDELIEMETNYSEVSKKLSNLKTEYRTRYLTTQIETNEKAINKTKTSLKDYDLTDEENKSKKSLDKKLTYDSEKVYTVAELSELNKTYKSVKSDYSTLLGDVKDRAAEEKAQAEANAIAQEQAVDYTNDYTAYDTPEYSTSNSNNQATASTSNSSNNSNTSSSSNTNDNASNSNSSNNSVDACYDEQGRFNSACIGSDGGTSGNGADLPDNICPYSSESEAWAVGENFFADGDGENPNGYSGFSTAPCDQGTWEVIWF
ncbi:hypothetical protein R2F61_07235 [Mollicutes bacterium LVI A0078]|nr:hypothetical protein RZE84_01895 [Mollicutes bacterium LVI A0075]WOO90516.1 hypothetical protein R2F61_07235 [Mollicutes bacterium LVI A0078]